MMGYGWQWNFMRGVFGGGWDAAGWMLMILFWIFIVLLIVAIVRGMTDHQGEPAGANRPLEILKERYAKGEIDQKEFEQKKKDLA